MYIDFWIRETGTGQQVAQLHDRYTMMMITIIFLYALMGLTGRTLLKANTEQIASQWIIILKLLETTRS